eukprot:6214821-Pleurochrysis_carterae.AAC.3
MALCLSKRRARGCLAMLSGAADHATLGDPTEYFLTCLHLLVNVGMACRDLFGAGKARHHHSPCHLLRARCMCRSES